MFIVKDRSGVVVAYEGDGHAAELFSPDAGGLEVEASFSSPLEEVDGGGIDAWDFGGVKSIFVEVVTEVYDEVSSWFEYFERKFEAELHKEVVLFRSPGVFVAFAYKVWRGGDDEVYAIFREDLHDFSAVVIDDIVGIVIGEFSLE